MIGTMPDHIGEQPSASFLTDPFRLLDAPLDRLLERAEAMTLQGFGANVSYSRKVFIPLTHLCRDVCHYCTFAKAPRDLRNPYLSIDEAIAIARAGAASGCREALFTLGDKPELRYPAARAALDTMGEESTLSYLETVARRVFEETGLLPHLNPGVMTIAEMARLRKVSASMGIMLETASDRLSEKGGPHWGSPDKRPAVRLETLRAAGELAIPFTTGLLIGIGETRAERIEALLAIHELHGLYGHIQEIIIQNFRAKPDTRMASAPEPSLDEQLWTIALTRLIFGPEMSIQSPPNLRAGDTAALIRAGVNDWGGVSPVTPDHVNPEAPWPELSLLAEETGEAGRTLVERLAIGPAYALQPERWLDPAMRLPVIRSIDAIGHVRTDSWISGDASTRPPAVHPHQPVVSAFIARILDRAAAGEDISEGDIAALFRANGRDFLAITAMADRLRQQMVGDTVSYVVNRNINYTNICLYHCGFCAFSKGSGKHSSRGPAYRIDMDEIARRASEAWDKGATEVCLQGGIHPEYTGETYLDIVRAVKGAVPDMHVHAFSPLEVTQGATTLGLSIETYLRQLAAAGLSTLPGTSAEVLDDDVRARICPDKLMTDQWLGVIETAHRVGLRTTATIMFGHVDQPVHWARHLLRIRALQKKTGGFTEFVPLPFVHMEAPMWRKEAVRSGPSFREAILMHAIARLALHPLIPNIQTSWVKMGREGAARALQAGVNDLGGVLMDESITRSAGGSHGQSFGPADMIATAAGVGRPSRQRTTLYGEAPKPLVAFASETVFETASR